MSAIHLNVVRYTEEHVFNRSPTTVTWQTYHTVRNAVVRACQEFGTTGPMGECPIVDGDDAPDESADWPVGDNPCDFFVVDDQYNEDEMYVYMEIAQAARFTEAWLTRMLAVLHKFPGWAIAVAGVKFGYVLVFEDRLMVSGPAFANARDVDDVLRAAVQAQPT